MGCMGLQCKFGQDMTFQRNSSAFQANLNEVQFNFDELLFSRTDDRGVIEAENDAFQRVSGFSSEELSGAPHKIVRHPDMPKGMFHIIWDRIQSGLPTGAYIVNRRKDGAPYWVFAVMVPVGGGFLSVRLRPSSKLFDQVRDFYKSVLVKEQDGMSPEDSADFILSGLTEMGFSDYCFFATQALNGEMKARNKVLSRAHHKLPAALDAMSTELIELGQEQERLFNFFEAIRGIPSNMRIVASRLEPAGGPISAISQNYRLMTDEVQRHLNSLKVPKGAGAVTPSLSQSVDSALFLVSVSQLLMELKELNALPSSIVDEVAGGSGSDLSEALLLNYGRDSNKALADVSKQVVGLTRSSKDLRQLVAGLDSIRVLCRVEAGRLKANSEALTPVIDQLDKFHKEIDQSLKRILIHADKTSVHLDSALANSVFTPERRHFGGDLG
jgi:aerotaxis receptor